MHIFQIDQNSYIQAATNATKPAWQEGLLFWDKDNHTYAVYNDQSGLTLKIGQETLGQIYAGENISAGDAITLSGSLLTYPIGFKAISDGVTKKYNVAGVAAQNILSASKGYVTAQGQVNDVNTSGYSPGSLLYLSGTTPGRYSLTPPDGNAVPTVVGYCLYQHTTAGKMLINISSNASSSSYANHARSASWAPSSGGGSTLHTGSTYPITSSWAQNVVSSSYADHALSASWAPGGSGEPTRIINGSVSASISPAGGLQVNTSASFEGDVLITGYIVNTKTPPANTNLLGYEAGLSASYAHHSNFVGDGAGNQAVYAVYSNFVGAGAGNQAANANNSNFIGTQAGEAATNAYDSNFIGTQAGMAATNAENSNFIGIWAGINAAEARFSNFMGNSAGNNAVSANYSNFFGAGAGSQATNAHSSNFIGMGSGNWAVNAYESNFIGVSAGSEATEANNSNFIGFAAGQNSVSASYSNFIGRWCGVNAPKANNSIFIGYSAGYADIVDNSVIGKSSILIGDFTSTGGNSNSIAIGQGVQNTLPEQVSIGNVLFATGIYTGTTTTGSVQSNGRVGIGVSNPVNALDVAGNISATVVSASLFAGTASYAKQARSASWAPSSGGGSTLHTGSTYPFTSSWAENARSASWAPGGGDPSKIISGSASASISPNNGLQINTGASIAGNLILIGHIVSNTGSAPVKSNFIGSGSGYNAPDATECNFIGYQAGYGASGSVRASNFIGYKAGKFSTDAGDSNFIGYFAGSSADHAARSNFIGDRAGVNAINAYESNFIGYFAGANASNAYNSNFIGYSAGDSATGALNSNFIGTWAGSGATTANNSIFIGYAAGEADPVNNSAGNSSSILIGDYTSTGGYGNSIAIGRGAINTAPDQTNIANVIFANTPGTTGQPQPNGKVGIGVSNPVNTLDVAGHISCSVITASLFAGTASYANQARSASWAPGGGGGTTLHTGSTYPFTSSWAENARSASWAPGGGTTLHTASTYPITSSWAQHVTSASFSSYSSDSDKLDGQHGSYYQKGLLSASTYPITSSWAAKAVSATSTTTATNATSASYLLGYRDTSRLVDISWEFLSAHQSADQVYDGWNIYNGTMLPTLSSTLGHPGVLRRQSSTSTTTPSAFTPGLIAAPTQPMHIAWGDFRSFETIMRNVQTAPDHIMRVGLFSDILATGVVRGFYFERTGSVGSITGSWRYAARSASINQSFPTSVKYGSGSAGDDGWHKFQLVRNNVTNKMHYLIDGIQYGTSSYIMPATTGYQFGIQIWPTIVTVRQFDIDWARITSYPITTVGRG